MTRKQDTTGAIDVKALLDADGDYLRAMVQAIVQATLEAEMTMTLGAEKGERTDGRLGYRSGYYGRALTTRVGTLELRVPQDRDGRFSTRTARCSRGMSTTSWSTRTDGRPADW